MSFTLVGRLLIAFALLVATSVEGQDNRPPIIDVHLHAYSPGSLGQPPNPVTGQLPTSRTSEAHMQSTLAEMDRHNVVLGVVTGPLEAVQAWIDFAPERFIAGSYFDRPGQVALSALRERFMDGRLGLMGEIGAQYEGLSPSDAGFTPYFDLAEEFGIPVGIHTGSGPARRAFGRPEDGARPAFRLRYGRPLLLEDMLVRHPRLRVYMMHAGEPWLTETLEMLRMYPDLYVDLSVKNWVYPTAVFHRYLKALVDAGFGQRPMFGSDQMLWPDAIGMAIAAIESADFLSEDQKRDIFFNNAVRFFRLEGRLGRAGGN